MAQRAKKKRKAPAEPSSAPPPRYHLVQNVTPIAPQKAPQQGRWVFRPPRQQGASHPLLLSKMAQGRMLHHPFVRAAPIIALIVGIRITLLVNALRAKIPGKSKITRTKGRLFKSGMERLISLHLLIFPSVHQS